MTATTICVSIIGSVLIGVICSIIFVIATKK